ncbi:MAG TPA: dTMP kinase [Myxococcota bacterium]|nr:dTMP kinase [Myxococcota bacterium]
MAGKLIVIEGMDGTGTTTQAKMLATKLLALNASVVESAEPTDSGIGQEIRRLLALPLDKEHDLLVSLALCFAADRMQHVSNVIAPGLKDKDFVLLDRYVLSSLVYQGLHIPTAFVKEINRFAPKPDLTLILDLDVTLAHERLSLRAKRRDFYETPSTLEKIRSRYLHFAKDEPAGTTVLIDASGSVEEVNSHILYVLREKRLF